MKVTTYKLVCTVDNGEGEPREVFSQEVPIGLAPTVNLERSAWRELLRLARAKVLPARPRKSSREG